MQQQQETITEGKTKIKIIKGKPSKKLSVFYNPIMEFNRTISLAILGERYKETTNKQNNIQTSNIKIALPLSASGVRGVRILNEIKQNKKFIVYFNDLNPKAIELIKQNLEINNITERFQIYNKDATIFLIENKPFDYIDIDPFGTPNPFLDAAIKSIKNNGIIAVTATDTAPLSGTYPETCLRKYWAIPIRSHIMHEIGLRILIRKIQLIGVQYNKALIPILSYSKDHYFRTFLTAKTSKQESTEIIKQHKTITTKILQNKHENNTKQSKESIQPQQSIQLQQSIGPIWTGNLYNKETIAFIINYFTNQLKETNKQELNFLKTIQSESEYEDQIIKDQRLKQEPKPKNNLKNQKDTTQKYIEEIPKEISKELPNIGFYDIHQAAKELNLKEIPKKTKIIQALKKNQFLASETHFSGTGIKTNATQKEFLKILKELV